MGLVVRIIDMFLSIYLTQKDMRCMNNKSFQNGPSIPTATKKGVHFNGLVGGQGFY